MAVSESQQLLASKIAYADLDAAYAALTEQSKTPVTLQSAIQYAQQNGYELHGLESCLNPDGSFRDEYSYANDWVITGAVNENYEGGTGLYACILDTGEDNILACRGSEDMENMMNYRQDWYGADLKLLNSEMTEQEAALLRFMQNNRQNLDNKPWVSTGHSLGGALADYAAIRSVDLEMKNYAGTTNFDGPGHSQEFIEEYADQISQVSHKMTHKKASIVGNILFDIPGVKQEIVQTKDVGVIDQHSMGNWEVDQNGNLVAGKQDWYEWLVEKATRGADRLPAWIGNGLVYGVNLLIEGYNWMKEFSEDHPAVASAITMAFVGFVLSHPALIVVGLKAVSFLVIGVIVFAGLLVLGEMFFEFLEYILPKIAEIIKNAADWIKEKAVEIYTAVRAWFDSVKEYLRAHSPGGKYVSANPYLKADTGRLRSYAQRLSAVNSRLVSLDGDMNNLYWQVGFTDLLTILEENLITGYSVRVTAAKKFLNAAADALENADRKVQGYMGG